MRNSTTFNKGHAVTQEMREKISQGMKGNKNGIGQIMSEKNKKALKERMKNRPISEETKKKISRTLKGRKIPLEVRLRMGRKGSKNPAWRGGMSWKNKTERQVAMRTGRYKMWRESIFKRDNYTCQICGVRGNKLNADHILPWRYYPANRYDVSNGRTLCVPCHIKTPTYSRRQEKQISLLGSVSTD